jgi:hypothetical protein
MVKWLPFEHNKQHFAAKRKRSASQNAILAIAIVIAALLLIAVLGRH